MIFRLLFLGIILPLLDILLFIRSGALLGRFFIWPLLFSLVFGLWLWRSKGGMRGQIRASLTAGLGIDEALLRSLLRRIAAVYLIFPGLITDIFALSLLMPHTLQNLKQNLGANFKAWIKSWGGRSGMSPEYNSAEKEQEKAQAKQNETLEIKTTWRREEEQ